MEVLTDALSLPETPVPLKVARLLLASDILHNSTAPVRNASRYRSLLEAALPNIFESLQVHPTLSTCTVIARHSGYTACPRGRCRALTLQGPQGHFGG